jgi:hypothetical protein
VGEWGHEGSKRQRSRGTRSSGRIGKRNTQMTKAITKDFSYWENRERHLRIAVNPKKRKRKIRHE